MLIQYVDTAKQEKTKQKKTKKKTVRYKWQILEPFQSKYWYSLAGISTFYIY